MLDILLYSLSATLILEIGYAWLWGVKGNDFVVIFLMNLLTNPLVVLWHHTFPNLGIWINTVAPEIAAVFVEVVLLSLFSKRIRKPVLLGICINIFSYFSGLFLNYFLFQ